VHTAARVPGLPEPFDTAHVKLYYPAAPTGDDTERLTGTVAADRARAPFPVVVLLPGVNVAPDCYRWLAVSVAARGYAVAVPAVVEEVFGAGVALGPGIDVDLARPGTYGTAPTARALAPVLDAVARLGKTAPLDGLLDLDRVALGGHSAGGTVALQSASRSWFPGLRAAFAYGAHLVATTALGWPSGTVLAAPDDLPVLLATGSDDGVMAASAVRYGEETGERADPVERTFVQSLRGPGYRMVLDGANHFTCAHPVDPTSARSFLEEPATGDEPALRRRLAEALGLFLDAHVRDDATAAVALAHWTADPPDAVHLHVR
jgi:dienelactone hydrolase